MLADILYFEGRWDEAEELLRQAPSASGFPVATVEVRRVAAQIASARGQVAAAEQLLAPSDSEGTARGDKELAPASPRPEPSILCCTAERPMHSKSWLARGWTSPRPTSAISSPSSPRSV